MTIVGGVFAWLAVMLAFAIGSWAIRAAKKGGRAINVIGTAATLMTLGNVQDPTNEAVLTAQQPRKKQSGDSGDPPNDRD